MKKLVLILSIFVLLMSTAHADINARRDSLRTMAFEQALVPSGGNNQITTDIGDRFINRATQQVCRDFPAIEGLDTIVSVQAQIEYSLNTDFLSLKTIFKLTTFQNLKIIYSLTFPPVGDWFEIKGGEIGGQPDPNEKAEPRYAWAFRDNVYFYPTPQTADSFVVLYYATDSLLSSDDDTTRIRPEYREEIITYAAYLISIRRGDYQRATFLRAAYDAEKANRGLRFPGASK